MEKHKKYKKPEKDYRTYTWEKKGCLQIFGISFLLTGMISWLFYKSVYGMVLFPIVAGIVYVKQKKKAVLQQQQNLRHGFLECIRIVTASLYSGYSIENAFGQAEKELVHLLGKESLICQELLEINQKIRLNVPVESLLENLAKRSGVEEILNFSQVFGYAKRNGSDFIRILKDTTDRILEKHQIEKEIETLLAAKKLEQNIMNVVPMGILFFVNVTSPDFLNLMYQGIFGRTMMSVFLVIYAGAYFLSEKIVGISV